jgi:hypothetical protein
LHPATALQAVKAMRERLRNPRYSPEAFLELLGKRGLPQTVSILTPNASLI